MPTQYRALVALGGLSLFTAACGGDPSGPTNPPPALNCTQPAAIALAPGEATVVDPNAASGCVRLPVAGAGGAQYLLVALSTAGQETSNGITSDYTMAGSPVAAPGVATSEAAVLPDPTFSSWQRPADAPGFHHMLRSREARLSTDPAMQLARAWAGPPAAVQLLPPTLGTKDTFDVCGNTACSSFVKVGATAVYVGSQAAIYLDDTVPAGGFTQEDIDTLGLLFDGGLTAQTPNMYSIDTTAFGRPSDIDGDGVVVVLLTDAVNALSGTCPGNSIILGFFFGADLLPRSSQNPGSNEAEIFYGLVPNPTATNCRVSRSQAIGLIAPTFIHEFQHMISFNQHFLLRGGGSEQTWLNEGLSHFAEELGARLLPDGGGQGGAPNRFSQFAFGDVSNAYDYLRNPEDHFLVSPGSSQGTLEERGAGWLFVRWLADHFGGGANATALTRALVQTNQVGAANVQARTGLPMSTLVPEWQLANYLDNLSGFTPTNPRLQYTSFNWRVTFPSLGRTPAFPLVPDQPNGQGVYSRSGTLRAGSGRHLLVTQGAGGAAADIRLTRQSGVAFDATAGVRFAVVRIQ